MKKKFIIFVILLFLVHNSFGQALSKDFYENIKWQKIEKLPILYNGRIQPLLSFARAMLYKISGRTYVKTPDMKLSSIQWLMEVVLNSERAQSYKIFLVETPEILEHLGVEYQKKRAYYSFRTFLEKRMELYHFANLASQKLKHKIVLQRVEQHMLILFKKLELYNKLQNSFDFLKTFSPYTREGQKQIRQKFSTADYFVFIKQKDKRKIPFFAKGALVLYKIWEMRNDGDRKQWLSLIEKEVGLIKEFQFSNIFTIFDIEKQEGKGVGPWNKFFSCAFDIKQHGLFYNWIKLYFAYRSNNVEKINFYINQLSDISKKQFRGNQYSKLLYEVSYYKHSPFYWTQIFYMISLFFCLILWSGVKKKFFYYVAIFLIVAGYVFHSYGIVLRMLIRGRPPVTNLYETILFTGWTTITLSFIIEVYLKNKVRVISLFSGTLIGILMLFIAKQYSYKDDNMGVLKAVLNSNFWLASHVTTIIIGYAACLMAGIYAHISLFYYTFQSKFTSDYVLSINRILYGILCFSLLFVVIGTILGGYWADQSWGRFWGWDPKENGALILILWLSIIIHAYKAGYILNLGLILSAIFTNIVVMLAWWGVNLLNVGLHSYGRANSNFEYLVYFILIELIFIIAGFILNISPKFNS